MAVISILKQSLLQRKQEYLQGPYYHLARGNWRQRNKHPVPPHRNSPLAMTDSAAGFFDTIFKPSLEDAIPKIHNPLPQANQAEPWVELYAETDESLKRRFSTHNEVSESGPVTSPEKSMVLKRKLLPTIPRRNFYAQLEQWWASRPLRESLSEVTGSNLPGFTAGQSRQPRFSRNSLPADKPKGTHITAIGDA
ncbi:hypothetical protein PAAG_00200 [Paracoccidioides lutzii Pb01]|uniref:Uncharacterized protein n=1 Tax=Paracoccidioides lutzii (strain ATCC MYA-826 / Pb01) TaxID=502779 RepID=C1GNV5_PARBA|nr:hypothetical protein PAAG_00200 [Paracoccidioides lutzii Pb01]EEH35877.2 hypothetical protein PAAG_00200 [Paracoccidioides lutzii Pb01]